MLLIPRMGGGAAIMRFTLAILFLVSVWSPNLVLGQRESIPPMVDLIESFVLMSQVPSAASRSIDSELLDGIMANRKAAFSRILNRSFMKQNGRSQLSDVHRDLIWDELKVKLRRKILSAYQSYSVSDEITKLHEITTDGILHDYIANYLGLPKPRRSEKLGGVVSAEVPGPTNRLYVSNAIVTAEVGGLNAGNGISDAGEWVQLGFKLVNGSDKPWFSTSVFTHSGSPDCLWVRSLEFEPGEFLEPGSSAVQTLWVFIPPSCKSTPILNLKIKDTHRSPSGLSSSIRLVLGQAPKAKIVDVEIDADIPGESRGSGNNRVEPGDRIELSHGLQFDASEITFAEVTVTLPTDQRKILGAVSMTSPFRRVSANRFEAGNDFDLVAIEKKTYLRQQRQYVESRKFFPLGQSTGTLWVSVDVRSRIASKRPKKSVSIRTSKSLSPSRKKTRVTAKAITQLFRQNLRFESRMLRPKNPDAIAAVGGHDILFDGQKFEAQVATLIGAGATSVKEQADEPDSHVFETRLYLAIDMVSLLKPAPVVRYRPRPRPTRRRVPKKKTVILPDLRTDFGYGSMGWEGRDSYPDAELGLFSTTVFFGKKLTGLVHLHAGGGSGEFDDSQTFGVVAGGGYIFGNSTLEFHPRIGLGLSHRSVEGPTSLSETSLTLMLAATARVFPTKSVGFYVSWDCFLRTDTPDQVGQLYDENYSFLGLGLSLRL